MRERLEQQALSEEGHLPERDAAAFRALQKLFSKQKPEPSIFSNQRRPEEPDRPQHDTSQSDGSTADGQPI